MPNPQTPKPGASQMLPRAAEFTGRPSAAESRAAREWSRARSDFRNATARYGFGTPAGREAWQRLTRRSRSA